MKKFLIRLVLLVIVLGTQKIGVSDSYLSDVETSTGSTFTAGCWSKPTTSELVYPNNGYVARPDSDWLNNPYMDWIDSRALCSNKAIVYYQYESYHDEELTSLAFRSGPLVDSMIPAPGTPDGTYYWRARAYDGGYWSEWSDVWTLIVDRSIPSFDEEPAPPSEISEPEIVLNEILPNPSSGQEWIELYNKGDTTVDLVSWRISELSNPQTAPVEKFYDISSLATNTGSTTIAPHGWLVVYFSGFKLNNDGDTVGLYNDLGILQDSHTYSDVLSDKSIARIPDGADTWYDPIPTPGAPNLLEINEEMIVEDTVEEAVVEEPEEEQEIEKDEDIEPEPEEEIVDE